MIGGIFCDAPLRPPYGMKHIERINQNMTHLFGSQFQKYVDAESINAGIIKYWRHEISRNMGKVLSSWSVPSGRMYYNRTVDLTRSMCLGIYYKSTLRDTYVFSGGKRDIGYGEANPWGSEPPEHQVIRMERLSKYHPDPHARAAQFLSTYKPLKPSGFTIVIAATMPYAVKLESSNGYGLPVLSLVYNRLLRGVYNFNGNNHMTYGYIFEKTGGRQIIRNQ